MSLYSSTHKRLERVFAIKRSFDGTDWKQRAMDMAQVTRLTAEIELMRLTTVDQVIGVVETPSNWFTSKGMASKDSEDIQKLYWFVGAMAQQLTSLEQLTHLYAVIPQKWKGQTPKPVMVSRAKVVMERDGFEIGKGFTHDAAEAVLMAIRTAEAFDQKKEGPIGWDLLWSNVGDQRDTLVNVRRWYPQR
jgi:hypothetical protein